MGKSTISMAMFNSYVSLPEAIQFATEVPTFQANKPLKRRKFRRTLEPCPNLASTTTQVPRVSTWWKDGTLWL